jgi:NAD(P)-dependent dehydrogenase (short-subunit alcohol dehydrogenase family)
LAGLLNTRIVDEGIEWRHRTRDAHADGGNRLSKEAIILYSVMNAVTLGAKGIRINCTLPEVTETPILDLIAGNLATQDATQGS